MVSDVKDARARKFQLVDEMADDFEEIQGVGIGGWNVPRRQLTI